MSVYPPPREIPQIFNPFDWLGSDVTNADLSKYMTLATSQVASGLKTFSNGLITANLQNNANTFTFPASSGQLLTSGSLSNYVTTNTVQTISAEKTFLDGINTFDITAPSGPLNISALNGLTIDGFSSFTDPLNIISTGTASVPSVSVGSNNTGIYAPAVGQVGVSSNGSLIGTFGNGLTMASGRAITCTGSGLITSGSGGFRCTSLGSASVPILSIGVLGNDGIFSSAAGSINITTAGSPRFFCSASGIGIAANLPIICTGTSTITSGSGGFTTASGPLSIGGASTLNGGARIGTNGTTIAVQQQGAFAFSGIIASGGFAQNLTYNFPNAFPSAPLVLCSLFQNAGSSFFDQCSVTCTSSSTTSAVFMIKNNAPNATAGGVQIIYKAWTV